MVTKLFISLFLAVLSHCQCNNVLKSAGFSLNLVAENSSTDYLFSNAIAYGPIPTRYTIDVAIGTPGTVRRLSLDIKGSITWTQCKPCITCFKQTYSFFDPRKSTSYKKVTSDPHNLFWKSDNGEYRFKSGFDNGLSISGIASIENFTFTGNLALKGIVFGCANKYKPYNRRGQFFDRPSIAGILGLNRSPTSLVSQLGSQRFSYCFPNFNVPPQRSGLIRFGDRVIENVHLQKTDLLSHTYPLYSVNLLKISIAGCILCIPKNILPSPFYLDLGIRYSRIKIEAYNEVLKALQGYFRRYNLTKVANSPSSDTHLCYRLSQGFKEYTKMVLHFPGANFEIGRENLFLFMKDRFRLALMSTRRLQNILATYQMQNVRFIYDNGNDKLLFGGEDCPTVDTSN
ncbi:hypothetical protein ACJIZ3_007388 [Penstemon smallii]|uniref:Peptidase A1 domain-containing protein n=1 Tax=Penstemon smallii TaxID=265156 RepID=A0ABD3SAD1_9LAMI